MKVTRRFILPGLLGLVLAGGAIHAAMQVATDDTADVVALAAPIDVATYSEVMARRAVDIYGLENIFARQQSDNLPLILPGMPNPLVVDVDLVPFDFANLPKAFDRQRFQARMEYSVPVYPVLIREDITTRETLFCNMDGDPLFSLPPDPMCTTLEWIRQQRGLSRLAICNFGDPAMIQTTTRLIAPTDVEKYILS